MQQIIHMSF